MTGTEITSGSPPPEGVHYVVEHLFRHEAGKMLSTLTRIFGAEHLKLAEDIVQEALVKALQTWPYYGIPKNPAGWITQTAKNLALDFMRREKVFSKKEPHITALMESAAGGPAVASAPAFATETAHECLRPMFACC